ncbi:hypothetical protein HRbin36_01008 [bacterium HR36]|nr:hypothetical protein HRbin36_01008 [bacterium HR36]
MPDSVIVFLGHGVVTAALIRWFLPVLIPIPVHPIAQPYALLRLNTGKAIDPLLAQLHETVNAGEAIPRHEVLNILLRSQTQFFFHFHFDPQSLAIETVLVAEFVAGHGHETLEQIFIGASPGMVHAHRVVGSNGTIQERPFRLPAILFPQFLESLRFCPEAQNLPFQNWQIQARFYFVERHRSATPSRAYDAPLQA